MRQRSRVKLLVLGTTVVGAGLTAAAAALLGACSIDIDGTEAAPADSGPAADVTVPRLDGSPLDARASDAADASPIDGAPPADAAPDADAGDSSDNDGGPYAANHAALFSGDPSGFVNASKTVVTDDFTLEAWIAPSSITTSTNVYEGNQLLIADVPGAHADWSSYLFSPAIVPTPVLAFTTGYADGTSDSLGVTNVAIDASATPATWTHIAIVRSESRGQVLFYLNGAINVNTTDASTDPLDAGMYMAVGGSITAGGNRHGFSGLVDEVRVWSYARAGSDIGADQVDQLSAADVADPRLVLYYKFDETTGATRVHDYSGSRLDGVLVGDAGAAPTFVPVTNR